jgi:hypothetical protein
MESNSISDLLAERDEDSVRSARAMKTLLGDQYVDQLVAEFEQHTPESEVVVVESGHHDITHDDADAHMQVDVVEQRKARTLLFSVADQVRNDQLRQTIREARNLLRSGTVATEAILRDESVPTCRVSEEGVSLKVKTKSNCFTLAPELQGDTASKSIVSVLASSACFRKPSETHEEVVSEIFIPRAICTSQLESVIVVVTECDDHENLKSTSKEVAFTSLSDEMQTRIAKTLRDQTRERFGIFSGIVTSFARFCACVFRSRCDVDALQTVASEEVAKLQTIFDEYQTTEPISDQQIMVEP